MLFDLLRARGRAAAFATALLGMSGSAFAGAGEIDFSVRALSDAVTYSRAAIASPARPALNTLIGYEVRVANVGGNTINNIRFIGTASATDADEAIEFAYADGASCTGTGGSVECWIGQLKAGQAGPTFAVFFKSPIKDTVSPLPDGVLSLCEATDCASFTTRLLYAEGTGGENSIPPNSAVNAVVKVALGTPKNTEVKTALGKNGGTLFTGDGGVTTGNDKFSTAVTVPPLLAYTTATVDEAAVLNDSRCTRFSECFSSTITIPGTFSPYLSITLRQDASTILRGTKIESVLIEYTGENFVGFIGECASPTTPNANGVPCIAKRTFYRNKSVAGWTEELNGDFEWLILNITNGSYKGF